MLGNSLLSAAAPLLLPLRAALEVAAAVAAAGGGLAPVTAAPLCMPRRWSDASICMVEVPRDGEIEGLAGTCTGGVCARVHAPSHTPCHCLAGLARGEA